MVASLKTPHEWRPIVCIIVIELVCGFSAGLTSAAADPSRWDAVDVPEDSWQLILIDGSRVGYTHVRTTTIGRGTERRVRTSETTMLSISRFGQDLRIQTRLETEETMSDDLVSFSLEMKNPGAASTSSIGTVGQDGLEIRTTVAGRTTRRTVPWDGSVKAPAFQDRMLKQSPLKPGERRSLRVFLPQFGKAADVRFEADQVRSVKLFDGSRRKLLKLRITQSVSPETPIRAWTDEKGDTLKSEMDLLGRTMITYEVDEAVAVEAVAGPPLDLAVDSLVSLGRPLPRGHRSQRVVYRITSRESLDADTVPSGETQQVETLDEWTLKVTVAAAAEPTGRHRGSPGDEFTASTQFLQCTDARVIDHANRAAPGGFDVWKTCRSMEKYVHEKLRSKNFSTALASAAEVARTLEGDCTEHAVLLAAMLRVKRIPSRIAVGLVYIESQISFGGHMWTEAFVDGRWIPLDATLGRGGIGAAHIKLADSGFADSAPSPVTTFLPLLNVLGRIEIEVVEAE